MTDVHRREYLILLRRLRKRLQYLEGRGVQGRMALRIHELEQQFECNGRLRQGNYLSLSRDAAGREATGAEFEILAMEVE